MTALKKRTCGPCQACCVELKIDTPEFRKKAEVACPHLTPDGCIIYETRYRLCQEFLCGWRTLPELDDAWRPDKSGVLVMRKGTGEVPPGYDNGIEMVVLGGEDAVTRPAFVATVARLMRTGTAVLLPARSPSTIVNEHLDAANAGTDLPGLAEKLAALYRLLHAARWSRGKLAQIVPLYKLQLDRQTFLAHKRLSPNN